MKKNNLYTLAHLVVAAIRIHEHKQSGPPTIENICDTLLISLEEGNRLILKLSEMQVIEALEKPGGARLFVNNHLLIEDIPNQPEINNIQSELDQFKESRKEHINKIKSIQTEQAEKKKKLQEELDQKLKSILKNRK